MKFTHAITKKPCKNIIKGITKAGLGIPNYKLALHQHEKYCDALKNCGLDVTILDGDENFADSTFVEDTAVLTPKGAIITNPGAESRRKEINNMIPVIERFYNKIECIGSPGTLDGGDVMNVDGYYYIGLSSRTNKQGAEQLIKILRKYGFDGTMVGMSQMLHLKSGVAYLGNNNLVVAGEFIQNSLFEKFNRIKVPAIETYAANCININGKVLVPSGFNETQNMIEIFGFETIALDMSEFRKVDGGLSCLSLRFSMEM